MHNYAAFYFQTFLELPEIEKTSMTDLSIYMSGCSFGPMITPLCPLLQVDNLTAGTFYEFKVQAANMAGVGVPSAPSAAMKCEAWTMEEPGRRTTTIQYRQHPILPCMGRPWLKDLMFT